VASCDRDPRVGYGSESRYRTRFHLAAPDHDAGIPRIGNLATIGASAARALQFVSGTNDVPVSITWSVSGGLTVTRDYEGFWQAAEEEALARIVGGIHYRFDQENRSAGRRVGRGVRVHQLRAAALSMVRLRLRD